MLGKTNNDSGSDSSSMEEENSARLETSRTVSSSSCNPCTAWLRLCQAYYQLHCVFFRKLTNAVANHPIVVLVLSTIIVAGLSVGFLWFDMNTRTEQLFIPQGSKAMKDLRTADKYFPLKVREATVLVIPVNGGNVLTSECFEDVLSIHNAIVGIPGYSDVCIRINGPGGPCLFSSPMGIFNYNSSNFNHVTQTLTRVLLDPGYLMPNGRPGAFNFPRMFARLKTVNGSIVSAEGVSMTFLLLDNESNDVLDWEGKFIDKMMELQHTLAHVKLYFSADRSLDDSVMESSTGDVTLFSVTIAVMMLFTCVMLGKLRNPLTGHSFLSCAGLLAVGFGIASAFGLCLLIGVPFISITGVLPFLVMGIGIDDMFIIVDELDRQPSHANTITRLVDTMTHVGATITMTTITDLVAFAVSTSSQLPAITHFCTYAGLSISFAFLFLITFFVVFAMYDDRRMKDGKRDCLPCCNAPLGIGEITPETKSSIASMVMRQWGKFLMFWPVKIIVLLISMGLLGAGIYGALNTKEDFDPQMLAKDGSYFIQFFNTLEDYFPKGLEISIVLEGDINYTDPSVRKDVLALSDIATSNEHYADEAVSWINAFNLWTTQFNVTADGDMFLPAIKTFLNVSSFAWYRRDVVFNDDETEILASRILVYYEGSFSAISQRDAMLSLREDLDNKSPLPAFGINRLFIYFEQYAITQYETTRNLLIASLTILIVTSPSLANPGVIFLVFMSFVSLVIELLGLMYIWDVSLNGISMLIIVMAVGFAVDYSAHIAHAFVTSHKSTPEERVVDSLSTVGASVVMGGLSTFLGMSVISVASSEVFRIFFRMFFGIVSLGLLHGLCFLPVLMALFCRFHVEIKPRTLETEMGSVTMSSLNHVPKNSDDDIQIINYTNEFT